MKIMSKYCGGVISKISSKKSKVRKTGVFVTIFQENAFFFLDSLCVWVHTHEFLQLHTYIHIMLYLSRKER